MSNSFNEYVKTAPTPPPPPLGLMYTENQNIKNSADLTNDQALHFDENLEKLNNILANVSALVGLAKENPLVLAECQQLLQNAADIDLPSEIKNQKIASCPTAVQNMYKQLKNNGSAQALTQAAKDQNIYMQVQQNLINSQNEQYRNMQHYKAMDAIDNALANNQPITTQMVCEHCQVMNDITNTELHGIKKCNDLMKRYLSASTPEERKQVLNEMREEAKYARKEWDKRRRWHKSTRNLLDSGRDLTPEQLKFIDESLKEEEKVAKQMLQQAKELRELAAKETDPQKRKEMLGMADYIEKGGYDILNQNKQSRQAYNRRVRGRSTQANQSETTNESHVKNSTATQPLHNEEETVANTKLTQANQSETTNESHVKNSIASPKGIQKHNDLMQRYLSASTQEERNQVLNEIKGKAKNAQKQWTDRKNWHNSLNVLLDSGVDITHEQMQTIHDSLKEEEKVAKQMLQKAKELRELANNESDPQKQKELLNMATHLEKGSSEILSYNTKTMQAYDRKIFGTEVPTVSYNKDNIFSQSQPDKPLTLNFADKETPTYAVSINPFQEKGKPNKTEEQKDWHKKTRETLSSSKELSSDELKSFDNNLKQEANKANTFLKTADEFRIKAEKETNPQRKADWLNISDSLETKAYGMLFENQSSRIVYNQKTKAYDQQGASVTNDIKADASAENKETPQQSEQTNANKSSEQKSTQPKNEAQPKEPTKLAKKDSNDKDKDSKTAETTAQQPKQPQTAETKETNEKEATVQEPQTPKEQPLTLTLNHFGQSVVFLDDENNTQTNPYDYSAYTIW